MLVFAAIIFPAVLLGGAIVMERMERQLTAHSVGERVVMALTTAGPDEVETLVMHASEKALDRHWRQLARRARLASAYPFGRG